MKLYNYSLLLPLILISSLSLGQTCTKTVTFTELVAGPCLVNNEGGSEDPAVSIYCDNSLSTLLYAAEWSINVNATGTYALPGTPWGACGATNSWVVGAIPAPGNSLSVFVQTYEGDDSDCLDPMDGADDCGASGTVALDLSVGTHTLSLGSDISFNYEVTETTLISDVQVTDMTCTSTGLYDAELVVDYVLPSYPCSVSGSLGNLVVNGQTFAVTGSPQTVTLTGLTANGTSVDVSAYFDGDHSTCVYTELSAFTAPDATTCAYVTAGGQACRKQITFTDVIAGAALVGSDDNLDGIEDPAISIYCDNSLATLIYAAEWALDITSETTYALPGTPWGACSHTNTFTLGPDVNPGTTQLPVYFQTYEGDDSDCNDPMDIDDDARGEGAGTLDLSAGYHTIDLGNGIAFMYQVRNMPIVTAAAHISNTCVSIAEFSGDVEFTYDISQNLLCTMTNGSFGNINANGQSFALTSSPQTVTLTNLPTNSGNLDISVFIEGDHSSCVSNFTAVVPEHDCTILGAELANFEAIDRRSFVDLVWSTSTETNSDYFILEKSYDGDNWQEIAQVESNGNSTATSFYNFEDFTPLQAINYYSLTEVDLDGSKKHLGVRSVMREGLDLVVYPNPAQSILKVSSIQKEITITDVFGRTVLKRENIKSETNTLNISNLASGTYFVSDGVGLVSFTKL